MTNRTGLEALSAELFSDVLDGLPNIQDRLSLSLVSKTLHSKVIPYIYYHWKFDGYTHSFKSLYLFLRTMIENRVLASHVQSMDIRDWDKKRSNRLAAAEDDDEEEESDLESQAVTALRLHGKGWRPPKKAKKTPVNEELERQEALEEETYDQYIPFFKTSLQNMLVPQVLDALGHWFYQWISKRDPDILLAVLIISLPKLASLYMAVPEEQEGVLAALAELGGGSVPGILEDLKKIYICSALYLGINGHRQYDLDSERIVSLLKIRSLRSLSILNPFSFNQFDTTYNDRVLKPLSRISNLTDLAFDVSQSDSGSIISMLSIPKSLKSLRWTQTFYCYSIGSCIAPFYDTLGIALIHHKERLEELDLDLRYPPCGDKGHAGNPHAKKEDMWKPVRDTWRSDCHLLGSLKEFSRLKKLKINPEVLCGSKPRGIAPVRLSDSLPPSLEELTLPFHFSVLQDKRNIQLREQVWIPELVHLVQTSANKLSKLRKITVLDWNPRINWPRIEDIEMFRGVETASVEVGINFMMLKETSQSQTPVPYFLEILPTRNPGRDY